jgi:hypothetical protein
MTPEEAAFLAIIVALTAFPGVLAGVSWVERD